MDSDTSSEDEEQSAMLREAVGEQAPPKSNPVAGNYQRDKTYKEEKKKMANPQISSLPSLRPDKEIDLSAEEAVILYTDLSKGAREFVAKKLSEHLDSELDTAGTCFNTNTPEVSTDEGIRLFSGSKGLTTSIDQVEIKQRRRKISSSGDSSSEDERLKEAVVSHDFIVKQSQEPVPSNIKPADIVINNTGDAKVTINGNSDKKKKKKKKKKSKMDEDNT